MRRALDRRVLIAVGAFVVALIAFEAFRYASALLSLRDARGKLNQAMRDLDRFTRHPDKGQLARIQALIDAAQRDVGGRSARVADGAELNALTHLPGIGAQVRGLRQLRLATAAAVQVAQTAMPAIDDVVDSADAPDSGPLQRTVQTIARRPALLDQMSQQLDVLSTRLETVRRSSLWWPLSGSRHTLLRKGDSVVSDGRSVLTLAGAVDRAMSGHHRYLLLLGNPAEQRPGGGFIGVIGTVQVDDGTITSSEFVNPNIYRKDLTDLRAPRALDEYMFAGRHWELPDANWDPDFAGSAKELAYMWARVHPGQAIGHVDGVLSIDSDAVGRLIKVLGPVHVPGYAQVITAKDTTRELTLIANKIRPTDPGKDFLVAFGKQLMHEVTTAPGNKAVALSHALAGAIPGPHLLMAFDDPAVQRVVAASHADGALGPISGADQATIVDANISGGKNDLFVKRSQELVVTEGDDGSITHDLTLRYLQPVAVTDTDKKLQPGSGGAFRDYIQVFVPADATLGAITIDGKPGGPESFDVVHGLRDIAFFEIVAQGAGRTVTVEWTTHPASRPDRFVLGKQLQAIPRDVTLRVAWAADVPVEMHVQPDSDLVVRRSAG